MSGPRLAISASASGCTEAGARPLAFSPWAVCPSQTIAKRSPPIPVENGSTTHSIAAAVTAASTALPPSSSTRSAARVASGWLVAAMAWAATAEERRIPTAR